MPDGQSSYAKHIKQNSNFTFCLIFTVLSFFFTGELELSGHGRSKA